MFVTCGGVKRERGREIEKRKTSKAPQAREKVNMRRVGNATRRGKPS